MFFLFKDVLKLKPLITFIFVVLNPTITNKGIKKSASLLFFILSGILAAQENGNQTIRGVVVDSKNEYPLFGASIVLISETVSKTIGTTTDENGVFQLNNVPLGRQSFICSYLGFQDQLIKNYFVVSGKEGVLHFQLKENSTKLEEIIVSNRRKGQINNKFIVTSANSLEQEEIIRFSGTLGDVSKMAQNFAGVSGVSDARNDIIVRGNAPSSVLWRLEGLDIPSPNHWATLGTTGGPVSMLNTNNLRTSDFITGAFPAEFANATAAAFDLKLRNGNSNTYEFLGQIGFNGLEFGAEGPLNEHSTNNSFLVNYRYSTLELLNKMGIDFGTGTAIPKYQDLNFKVILATENTGQFSIWGLGGISDISFLADDTSDNLYSAAGENLTSGTNTGILGLNHKYFFNENTVSVFSIGLSGTKSNNLREKIIHANSNEFEPLFKGESSQKKISLNWMVNSKLNSRTNIKLGANFDRFNIVSVEESLIGMDLWFKESDFDENIGLLRFFGQIQQQLTPKLKINTGLNTLYLNLNDSFSLEPRMGLKYQLNQKQSLALAYGLHSQMQPLPLYFKSASGATELQNEKNETLDFQKSHHFVISFTHTFKEYLKLKLEGYYQKLFSIAVDPKEGSFSALNIGADFIFPNNVGLTNEGKGTNYGIEMTLQHNLNKGFYFLLTNSLFKSTYQGSDGIKRGTYYDSNIVMNGLMGKEIIVKNNLYLSLDAKLTYAGGRRYTPIDLDASRSSQKEVLDLKNAFEKRYQPYLRPDFKISLKTNIGKTTHTWSIDAQNFISRKNTYQYFYDTQSKTIRTLYHRRFLPDVRYQVLF